jgi:predicted nucleotidyltransferase
MRPLAHPRGTLAQPLDTLLGAAARVRVLRVLDQSPQPLAAAGVARDAELSHRSAAVVLAHLTQAGIVLEHETGASRVYTLSPRHPFVPALQALFAAERQRYRIVQETAQQWAEESPHTPLAIWLFGSVARHEDTFASDVDLAVVVQDAHQAHVTADSLREALAPVARAHAVQPNVVPYTASEVIAMPSTAPTMWDNLCRDAVVLQGSRPDALRQRLARTAGVAA